MFSFKKPERLSSKKDIETLFKENKSITVYPLRLAFRKSEFTETGFPARVLISAPKRNFKKAVDRNLLKRRIRESYRLVKGNLYLSLNGCHLKIDLHINFIGKKTEEFSLIKNKLETGLLQLIAKIKK
jgi:ribonuclease P protein component